MDEGLFRNSRKKKKFYRVGFEMVCVLVEDLLCLVDKEVLSRLVGMMDL